MDTRDYAGSLSRTGYALSSAVQKTRIVRQYGSIRAISARGKMRPGIDAMTAARTGKLDYEPHRPVRWRKPGWPLALAWLPCCLSGAFAGAYAATLVFWGEFHPGAWYVVPSRVLAGGGLAAAVTSPVMLLARLRPWAKTSIGFFVALCVTFALTLYALFALWGP